MRQRLSVVIAFLLLGGCTTSLTPTVIARPTANTTSPPVATRIQLVAAAIQGDWDVVQGKRQQYEEVSIEQVGTLTISGTSYEFRPQLNKTASDVEGTIQFLFNFPKGEVQIKYWEGVHPNDSIENFGSFADLAWCTFKSGSTYLETLLIETGSQPTTLNLIYPFNAIYFWGIGKSLE